MPLHPEAYSDAYARVVKASGVRPITLRDNRAQGITMMLRAGVDVATVSQAL